MDKAEKIKLVNPNAPRPHNGRFLGLPFEESDAETIVLCAPWAGAQADSHIHTAAANVLEASYHLHLYDPDVPDAWQNGLFLRLPDAQLSERGKQFRERAAGLSLFAESGESPSEGRYVQTSFGEVDKEAAALQKELKQEAKLLLDNKKSVGLLGGDSSTQLGLLEALAERHPEFGILHLGARMGLNASWPGPACSPETFFHHALQFGSVVQLTLAGARHCSPREEKTANGRENIAVFYQHEIRRRLFRGHTYSQICGDIVRSLPDRVYISFDIDALLPHYRPHSAGAAPGGFEFEEAIYLLKRLIDAELEIIGFGLCGVAGQPHEWDGQVGAQLLCRLGNLMGISREGV